jgi:hypothetical protein
MGAGLEAVFHYILHLVGWQRSIKFEEQFNMALYKGVGVKQERPRRLYVDF